MKLKALSLLFVVIAILNSCACAAFWLALQGRPSSIPKRFGFEIFENGGMSFSLLREIAHWVAAPAAGLLICCMVANVCLVSTGIACARLVVRKE